MAIRIRSGSRKKRYEVYWNNPFTGKRQSLYFSTEPEAEKEDALIKYRLKYEREWFVPESDDGATRKDKVNRWSLFIICILRRGSFPKSPSIGS